MTGAAVARVIVTNDVYWNAMRRQMDVFDCGPLSAARLTITDWQLLLLLLLTAARQENTYTD